MPLACGEDSAVDIKLQGRKKDSKFKKVWVPSFILLSSLYPKREGGKFGQNLQQSFKVIGVQKH